MKNTILSIKYKNMRSFFLIVNRYTFHLYSGSFLVYLEDKIYFLRPKPF